MSKKQNVIIVSDEEHATIMAALRFYQEEEMCDPTNRSDDIHEIATNGDVTSLDSKGIDDLCERINSNTEPSESLKQVSIDIARRVNELGFLKNDKPMGLTQAMEVAAATLGFRNRHAMNGIDVKSQESGKSSVPVKHWNCCGSEHQTSDTHQFDVDDQRRTGGQMYLDLGSLEGNLDDLLAVTMEVNTNPLNGVDHVPCAHIHFDGDNLAVSLFKIGNKILVRPETGIAIESFDTRLNAFGPIETMYWIK